MKKALSLVLALALLLGASVAAAEPKTIDGLTPRNITISPAGLNETAEEMVEQGYSPTTGRNLYEIDYKDGYLGLAVTGVYQPIMVQITNSNNGIGKFSGKGERAGEPYRIAPVNGTYVDVVYEACQARGGSETRMSYIFSDVAPDYVGYIRSARLTHVSIRQEWNCILCTSGYTSKDIPKALKELGIRKPEGATEDDVGEVFVNGFGPWMPYFLRVHMLDTPNNLVCSPVGLLTNVIPQDHQPANHTWKFTDDLPIGGDDAGIVYITFGGGQDTDSRLEYDPSTNEYTRIVSTKDLGDLPYCETVFSDAEVKKVKTTSGKITTKLVYGGLTTGEPITFSNVIVQGVEMKWKGRKRPNPTLVGEGNADYFMGGKHIAGVWKRDDENSRTVFYGEDGQEIELQRGRTLIILMGYNDKGTSVQYE